MSVVPPAVTEKLTSVTTSGQMGSGVLNQIGETFTAGGYRNAFLGVYDVDGYRTGLVKLSMERSAVTDAISEIRTVALVVLRAPDIDAAYRMLVDADLTVFSPAVELQEQTHWLGTRVFYARDPDGNMIELVEEPSGA